MCPNGTERNDKKTTILWPYYGTEFETFFCLLHVCMYVYMYVLAYGWTLAHTIYHDVEPQWHLRSCRRWRGQRLGNRGRVCSRGIAPLGREPPLRSWIASWGRLLRRIASWGRLLRRIASWGRLLRRKASLGLLRRIALLRGIASLRWTRLRRRVAAGTCIWILHTNIHVHAHTNIHHNYTLKGVLIPNDP